jgi:hypothetical protein
MTDAEAVEAYRRLLARSTPRTKPFEPSPEDAAEWRRLYERERRLG